ncbi:MAG: pyruvate ferredoxin oxidoreductase [Deltaproteobacteria bacterium]|nr:pyruvate ferredoxin oxidoreductase [Deltaproteobacteria bacterium]
MSKRVGMEASFAIAEAAKLARIEVAAAYPITPQTHIVERLSEIVADGEVDAEFICVESEHSAMSACLGSAAAGARTFTATAGQGLELMHEVLYIASSSRLPMVLTIANRALSGPLNVWGDHSDAMATRDCGWIQIFSIDGQEAFDQTICAFKISEDPKVLFPVMVHLDGFHVSHVVEPIILLDQEEVDSFLPPFEYPFPLHPDKPVTVGAFGPPVIYTEARKAQEEALIATKSTIIEVWNEYGKKFGRSYTPVDTYKAEDAETLLLTMGSFSQMAEIAVDKLRKEGKKVGLVKLRLWRPFPFEELRKAVGDARILVVFDRCLSYGGTGGPVCGEVKAAFYAEEKRPKIVSFVGGLGGRDVLPEEFEKMVERGLEMAEKGQERAYEMIGVRE